MTMLQTEADTTHVVTYIDVQPDAVRQAAALLEQYRETCKTEEALSSGSTQTNIGRPFSLWANSTNERQS